MKFTSSHEWIKLEDEIGTVGITKHAQKELGEIVYVELPHVGKHVKEGQEIAVLESTKAAADIYSPVSGEIIEVNGFLKEHADKINTAPESEGWLFRVKLTDLSEVEKLLTHEQYQQFL